ncbi:hypothetical protein BVRB_1g014930 [Beta vulgaris subsp. vulgaris]|nr:hypothetical protein BVRB_1g014930 [Beta vulgaris subsp. vulgaris]
MEDDGKTYPTLPANYITIVDLQKRWMKQQQQQQQEEEKKKQNNKKKEESIYSFSNKDEEDNHANQNSQFQKPNRSKFDNGNLNSVIRRPIHRNFHGKKRLEDEKIAKKVSNNPISEASENNADVTKVVIDDRVKQVDDRKVEHEKDAKKMKKKKKNKKNRRIQKQNHPMMKSNECCEVEERENQGKAETDKDDQTVEEKDNQETNADKTAEIELKLKEVSVSSRRQWQNNGRSRAAIKWRKPESGTKIWEVKKVKEIPAIRVVERENKGDEGVDVDTNSKPAHVMHEPVKEMYKCYRKVERQKHWEGNRESSPGITRELDEERENEGGKPTAVVEGYRGTSRGYSGVDRRRMGWSWRRNEGGLVWVKKTEVKS